jgi:hypothetical protein
MGLALEYNSSYHKEFPNTFEQTQEEHDYTEWKDREKIRLCREEGVKLIVVPHTIHYDSLYEYITHALEGLGYIEFDD